MLQVIQRLEFENVFPEEEKQDINFYLSKVSSDSLLRTIGFCNTRPLPNFDSFFSNPAVASDIFERVVDYSNKFDVRNKPEVISRHASLKLAEVILSNRETLIEDNTNSSKDDDELNLFKAFLLINADLNKAQVLDNTSEDGYEKLVDYAIIFGFPISDLAVFENDDLEFLKLVYVTMVKVEHLFNFLNSKPEFENLKTELISSFHVKSQDDFSKEMKYLFGKLLELKTTNNFLFEVNNTQSNEFISSMVSEDILVDEDFMYIKIHPLYHLEKKVYSVVNFFYVVDKFYRSSKFKLKEIYEADPILIKRFGNFFSFFNKEFSENYLMKNVLDEIFHKTYFTKKPEAAKELKGEPDYYLRHNNNIFIFENKDVLINKVVKSSADIEKINEALRLKFLGDENHTVGIGQLINTIEEILSKEFRFDPYVNSRSHLNIYPILLVHDRIFQSLGINYRLNQWFLEEVKKRIGDKYDTVSIKSLTIMDIDTFILWAPYLKRKDRHFREILDNHLKKLNKRRKINTADYQYGLETANKSLTEQITPLCYRQIPYRLPVELLLEKFKEVIRE